MIKPDEIALMAAIRSRGKPGSPGKPWPEVRRIAADLGIPEKRAAYIVMKWDRRGWWEYGMHCLVGWLTEEGWNADLHDIKPGPEPEPEPKPFEPVIRPGFFDYGDGWPWMTMV